MNNIWQLRDAKSNFSELVECALSHGAQIVTRRGQKTVVVLPYDEYKNLTQQHDRLSEFLVASPLYRSGLEIHRDPSPPRVTEIEDGVS